eukprot:2484670-Pyramimonas_sp.AAC.1
MAASQSSTCNGRKRAHQFLRLDDLVRVRRGTWRTTVVQDSLDSVLLCDAPRAKALPTEHALVRDGHTVHDGTAIVTTQLRNTLARQ